MILSYCFEDLESVKIFGTYLTYVLKFKINKMKTILTIILAALVGTFNAQVVIKSKTGPHGGVLNVEQGYKIEMIDPPGSVVVYLFDKNLEAVIDKDIRAEIMFVYAENAVLNKTLVACEKNGFEAGVENQYYFYSVVTFNISGKIITSKFENLFGLADKSQKIK